MHLYQELVPPVVQVVKCLLGVHIVHQDTAVGSAVEGHAQALEALLPRCVPDLRQVAIWDTRALLVAICLVAALCDTHAATLDSDALHTIDRDRTCTVTWRSSTCTSLVRKSAPIVALYWLLNFLSTYWFISEVLPTLRREYGMMCRLCTLRGGLSW